MNSKLVEKQGRKTKGSNAIVIDTMLRQPVAESSAHCGSWHHFSCRVFYTHTASSAVSIADNSKCYKEGAFVNLPSNLIVNVFSIAMLIIIVLNALSSTEKNLLQQKVFMLMLQIGVLMLVLDTLSRLDGNPGTVYSAVNHVSNFLVFLLSPVLPSLWLIYAHCQVNLDRGKIIRWLCLLPAIFIINATMLILSQFFGWFYTINTDNIYQRGPLFFFPASITIVLIFLSFVLIIVNRQNIERKHFISLVLFPIPPLVCIILQIAFYGYSLIMNGFALSLLIIFITIQNHRINTDYLTGAYNRKGLELYMQQKINTSTEGKTFSAILLDIDNFKSINDTYGHNTGDDILIASVSLLKSCLSSNDFIARFGGDEFFIILNASCMDALEAAVCKINDGIKIYNDHSTKPFKLGFSMGHAVYDPHSHMKAEEFQRLVDMLMYENKRVNKELYLRNKQATCSLNPSDD